MNTIYLIFVFIIFSVIGLMVILWKFENILDFIIEKSSSKGLKIGPWKTHLEVGRHNLRKIEKSAIARVGLGANDSEETIYWNAFEDSNGDELVSDNNYKIFIKNKPQVDYANYGFWSITVYGQNKFFVKNEGRRYSIKSSDENSDSFVLSRAEPNDACTWLPLPKQSEKISLALRCYLPSDQMKSGKLSANDLPIIKKI
ncbi:MAG: DUF1214 domain-containing protein [Bacteroidota bacterium]